MGGTPWTTCADDAPQRGGGRAPLTRRPQVDGDTSTRTAGPSTVVPVSAEPVPASTSWEVLAARQSGVLGRAQALRGGLSPRAWDWRLAHDWQSPAPGVAVLHRGTPTLDELAWAAVVLGGPGSCLTGLTALRVCGWRPTGTGPLDVLVHADRRLAPRRLTPGDLLVRYHRTARLDAQRHPARAVPVARVAVATLHAAAWTGSVRDAETVLASVVQQRLVTAPGLRDALALEPRLPRRALLRRALDDVELGAHARTELDLLAFLRRQRLPLPDRLQLRDRPGRRRYLDAWWERPRVAVEVDGAHHRDAGQWEQDLLRANEVQVDHRADRVLLLRLTGGQLRHDGARVAELLRSALASPPVV